LNLDQSRTVHRHPGELEPFLFHPVVVVTVMTDRRRDGSHQRGRGGHDGAAGSVRVC